jgi:hypothetical protein
MFVVEYNSKFICLIDGKESLIKGTI